MRISDENADVVCGSVVLNMLKAALEHIKVNKPLVKIPSNSWQQGNRASRTFSRHDGTAEMNFLLGKDGEQRRKCLKQLLS